MARISKYIVIGGFLVLLGLGCSSAQTVEAKTGEPLDASDAVERIHDVTQSEVVLAKSDNRTYLNYEGESSVVESKAVSMVEDYLFDSVNNLLLDFEGNTVCELPEETFTISSVESIDEVLVVTVMPAPEIDPEAKAGESTLLPVSMIETNCGTGESTTLDPDTNTTGAGRLEEFEDTSFTIKQETDSLVSVTDESGRVLIKDQISVVTFSSDSKTMLYRKGDSIEAMDTQTSSIKWSKKHGVGWHTALNTMAVLSALEVDILKEPVQEKTDLLIVDLETGETIDQFDFQGILVDAR